MLLSFIVDVIVYQLDETEVRRLVKCEICFMLVVRVVSDHIWLNSLRSVSVQEVEAGNRSGAWMIHSTQCNCTGHTNLSISHAVPRIKHKTNPNQHHSQQ